MVRLKDIALRAGCSLMTVSKALRGAPDISAETKGRIQFLAQQMGYVPNSMAQGLRSRTSHFLGLVVPTVANPIFGVTVAAIEERAHELGYELLLTHTLNDPEREETCLRRLLARRVDGLFIAPVYRLAPTAPVYLELAKRVMPTLILGHKAPFCSQFTNVESDDIRGSYLVTSHLLDLGHKRIAFLAGPLSSPPAQERLEGYRRALREADVEFDDHLVFAAGTTIEEGEKAALQMLNESVRVTAVQAVNDFVAIGASNVFLGQKLRIPQDLSVAGYGNILTSEHFRVPLTTVRQPTLRLGTAAMELMQQLLRGGKPASLRLSIEFLPRASTSAPGSA